MFNSETTNRNFELVNEYRERPIIHSVLSKIRKMFRDFGHVRENYKTKYNTVLEYTQMNVFLNSHKNPNKLTKVAAGQSVNIYSVLKY